MRALFYATIALVVVAVLAPAGCRRMRERVLLSLLRESARPLDVVRGDPPTFRFPPTAVRAVALIDYDGAQRDGTHVSFVPPDGDERYTWAASVCGTWSSACLESTPATTLSEITYGTAPAGLRQIEPADGPARALLPYRLYGLALFGDRLFALTAFYRDAEGGFHLMEGARFAEAVVRGRRREISDFLTAR
jgi:hypothetical protein